MSNRAFYCMNAWRWKCGLPEIEPGKPSSTVIYLNQLAKTEWSVDFEKLMRNRLLMGAIRYGKINAVGKPKYDYVDSIIKRANLYKKTGNQEYLVDIANCCLVEFAQNGHPNSHFNSIDDGDHVITK